MNCRQFRNRHASFVDDLLSAEDMRAAQAHLAACPRCACVDVRIRRSLMVVRSLPRIEPSRDFSFRLNERLSASPLATAIEPPPNLWQRPILAAAAGLLLFATLGLGLMSEFRARGQGLAGTATIAAARALPPRVSDAAFAAAVPTVMPVWSAVLAAGQLPNQFSTVDFVVADGSR